MSNAGNITVIVTCVIFIGLAVRWMMTWDWGGDSAMLDTTPHPKRTDHGRHQDETDA